MYRKLYYDLLGGFIIELKADMAGEWYLCDNPSGENSCREENWDKDTIALTPRMIRDKYEGKYVYCRQPDGTDSGHIYLTEDFCKLLGENDFHDLVYEKNLPKGAKAL